MYVVVMYQVRVKRVCSFGKVLLVDGIITGYANGMWETRILTLIILVDYNLNQEIKKKTWFFYTKANCVEEMFDSIFGLSNWINVMRSWNHELPMLTK